jgi:hypothetical protein
MDTSGEETKIVRHIRASRHGNLYVSFAGRADSSVPSAPTPNKWSQAKRESVGVLIRNEEKEGQPEDDDEKVEVEARVLQRYRERQDREKRDEVASPFAS